jgi:hypothetical protein
VNHPTDRELEIGFDRAGIPRRLLYPIWYRALTAIDIPCRPPVTLSFLGHIGVAAGFVVVVMGTAGLLMWSLGQISTRGFIIATLVPLVIAPISNWLRYRAIRKRIAAAGGPVIG